MSANSRNVGAFWLTWPLWQKALVVGLTLVLGIGLLGVSTFLSLAVVRHVRDGRTKSSSPAGYEFVPTATLQGWRLESDAGARGALALVTNSMGGQVQLGWNLGTGSWLQARYDFSSPVDVSQTGTFSLNLRGDDQTHSNIVTLMLVDGDGVFFGCNLLVPGSGLDVATGLAAWPVPKDAFTYFWGGPAERRTLDWTRVKTFFLAIRRPGAGQGGGAGRLTFSGIQTDHEVGSPPVGLTPDPGGLDGAH